MVQVVEAEAFGEGDALEERGPQVGVGGGFAEDEGGGVRGEEGKAFAG